MSYERWLDLFAAIALISVVIQAMIDASIELFDNKTAIWFRFSLCWYVVRWVGQGSAIVLAIDVLRR